MGSMSYEEIERQRIRFVLRIVRWVLLALVAFVLLMGSFFTVGQTERAVVTRFGAVVRIGDPGVHAKLPFVESVTTIPVDTQTIEWRWHDAKNDGRMETYSRDQQAAHLTVKVTLRVKDVATIYGQFHDLDGFSRAVIWPRAQVAVKEVFGQFNAIRVVQERPTFNKLVDEQFKREVANAPGGDAVLIDGLQVQDIKFSDAYEKAVEERMKAEVEVARIAQNLERERKQAEILVVQAKAEADSNLARAEAKAKATRLAGDAEAAAIRAKGAALHDAPNLVGLVTAERWDGKLPATMVPGSAVPFVNVK